MKKAPSGAFFIGLVLADACASLYPHRITGVITEREGDAPTQAGARSKTKEPRFFNRGSFVLVGYRLTMFSPPTS